ncbi:uncharacterized protein F5891DRAFT_1186201 [Suillus fuscotomentosus]|uniref:Fungal-type protein kinase domain-containing protein n=1 Tax=Suillus fuscotomentosus TaxID=1912939 RepID=A0AAD4HN99_9AGAM|nr:uncharacterized protein F5891DRAFT_1186201 [Suillus fuscotomentosus]KAG1902561.1 hypothetical protein F5891DRAFT_1186201 [Suillus fuscotomentosus]
MSSSSDSPGKPPMMTLSLELPQASATSFNLYLYRASLSSVGFPPLGGHTVNTVKGLLRSELDGHVIDESGLSKMKFTNSIFHALIPISSLQLHHIEKIKYHKKDGSPETDHYGSDDEFNGTVKTGLKRKQNKCSTKRDLQYLFHAVQWALHNRSRYPQKLPFDISPIERYWSAEFANSPIPDPYNMQEPDVALLYYKNKLQDKTWADVLSFVEHTSSNFAITHDLAVYWGSATKVYLIMWEQPWRRFIFAYSICADDLHAHYFDCSGLIMSLLTPIHKFPIYVTKAIATTVLADPQYFGLDPTIHMCIADCQGTHLSLAVGAKGWVVNNNGKTYSM